MTDEQRTALLALIEAHDLTYDYSDDYEVRARGREESAQISAMIRALGPENADTCRNLWNAYIDRVLPGVSGDQYRRRQVPSNSSYRAWLDEHGVEPWHEGENFS